MPDALSNFADEDTWMKMNKGFVADLDSLHMTPAVKVKSSLPDDENDVSPLSHTYAAILHLTKTVSTAASSSSVIVIQYSLLSLPQQAAGQLALH